MARAGGLTNLPPPPGRPRSGPWPALILGVLCAHLGLLGLLSPPSRPGGSSGRPGVVTLSPGKTESAPRRAVGVGPDGAVEGQSSAASTDPPAEAASVPPMPAPASATHPDAAVTSASAPQAPSRAGDGGSDEYLPRSALTVLPRVRSEVLLEYPPGAPAGRYRGQVTLFVDETGGVRRMRFETPDAQFPAVFQEEVRRRFSAATISPGELDGRPVKAQHVIVVDFDAGIGEDEASPPQR